MSGKLTKQRKSGTKSIVGNIPTWEQFLEVMAKYGFEVGFREQFLGHKNQDGSNCIEEEVILFHGDGIIIHAESFRANRVKYSVMYGEIINVGFPLLTNEKVSLLEKCSRIEYKEDKICIALHLEHGFIKILNEIRTSFTFEKKWTSEWLPTFVNSRERRSGISDFDTITIDKINKCVKGVQEIIFP